VTTHDKTLIRIRDMVKMYQLGGETVMALDGVSLDVKKGDSVSIIGPSGSGKSTLMNMIGCLDRPTYGEYWLDGEEVGKLDDNQLAEIRNRKIGFIFQNFQLLPRLTALENVELPLIYRGIGGKKSRNMALQCLEQVGLVDRANHLPNQLSGGQQQRVAIARALVGEPEILLADEPTGALDSRTSLDILYLFLQLHELGHTIILITHDLDVANRAKRIVRIQDGKLSEVGSERIELFAKR